MNSDVKGLVLQYISIWNERDTRKRRVLIDAIFTDESGYTDPNDAVVGRDAIENLVERLQAKFPDFRFALSGPINSHHQQVLFGWQFGAVGAPSPAVAGIDVALLMEGRIRQLYGFVDRPSA